MKYTKILLRSLLPGKQNMPQSNGFAANVSMYQLSLGKTTHCVQDFTPYCSARKFY